MDTGARTRLMAAIGAAIVATVLAIPSAPANAGRAGSAAPASAQPVTFHAHAPAATSGKIKPAANPLDITCLLSPVAPFTFGGITDSAVGAAAVIRCTFDSDGKAANVQSLNVTDAISHDSTIVNSSNVVTTGRDNTSTSTSSAPCLHGSWSSIASATVVFPIGYTPQTASSTISASTTLNFGDCPNDFVAVPDVVGLERVVATAVLNQAGLAVQLMSSTTSCDVPKFAIASQSPLAGRVVLKGSTVRMRQSSGLPPGGCE